MEIRIGCVADTHQFYRNERQDTLVEYFGSIADAPKIYPRSVSLSDSECNCVNRIVVAHHILDASGMRDMLCMLIFFDSAVGASKKYSRQTCRS